MKTPILFLFQTCVYDDGLAVEEKKKEKVRVRGQGGGFFILSSSIGITRFSQSIIFLDNSNTDDRQQHQTMRLLWLVLVR
jgi:hypothetical protein